MYVRMNQVRNLVLPSVVGKKVSEFSTSRKSSADLRYTLLQPVKKLWGKITLLISPFLMLLLPMVFGLLIYSGQYRTRSGYKTSEEKARPVVIQEANTSVK